MDSEPSFFLLQTRPLNPSSDEYRPECGSLVEARFLHRVSFFFFVPPNKPPSNRLLTLSQDEYQSEAGSVVEVDFYHANQLLPLPDDVIVDRVLNKYLAGCEPAFRGATVVDSSVLRFKGAVTLFGPGSHQVNGVCGLLLVGCLWVPFL